MLALNQLRRPLVLHVEDGKAQSEVLRIILESNGFSVLSAGSAEEALKTFRQTPVSLVLADHMLSGATGTQLAAQIKAIKPSVPIVLHSGTLPDSMRNLDGFVHKGEPVRKLVEFLRELIHHFWE